MKRIAAFLKWLFLIAPPVFLYFMFYIGTELDPRKLAHDRSLAVHNLGILLACVGWLAFSVIVYYRRGWFRGMFPNWFGGKWSFQKTFNKTCDQIKFHNSDPSDPRKKYFDIKTIESGHVHIHLGYQKADFISKQEQFSDAMGIHFYKVGQAFNRKSGKLPGTASVEYGFEGIPADLTFGELPKVGKGHIVLGRGAGKNPFSILPLHDIRFSLLFGDQNSGKTTLSVSLMTQLYLKGLPIIAIDFKNGERYSQFEDIGNIITATTPWEAYHIFKTLDRVSAFRSKAMRDQRKENFYLCEPVKTPSRVVPVNYPIFIFIDELEIGIDQGTRGDGSYQAGQAFKRAVAKWRSQGIWIIFSTQYPDKVLLERSFRSNISLFVGGHCEETVLMMVWHQYKNLKSMLPKGVPGRMLMNGREGFVNFQGPRIDVVEAHNLMKAENRTDSHLIRELKRVQSENAKKFASKYKAVEPLAL